MRFEESNNKEVEPSIKGLSEPIKYRFKHLPVHLALLHSGNVLAFGGSGNDEIVRTQQRSLNPILLGVITAASMRFLMRILKVTSFVQVTHFYQTANYW